MATMHSLSDLSRELEGMVAGLGRSSFSALSEGLGVGVLRSVRRPASTFATKEPEHLIRVTQDSRAALATPDLVQNPNVQARTIGGSKAHSQAQSQSQNRATRRALGQSSKGRPSPGREGRRGGTTNLASFDSASCSSASSSSSSSFSSSRAPKARPETKPSKNNHPQGGQSPTRKNFLLTFAIDLAVSALVIAITIPAAGFVLGLGGSANSLTGAVAWIRSLDPIHLVYALAAVHCVYWVIFKAFVGSTIGEGLATTR